MKTWEELNNFTEEELQNEQWKVINGFNGRYAISNLGRVKSSYGKGRVIKPARTRDDYWFVSLRNNGKSFSCRLNRLVALNFIPNPQNKPEVNHIKSDELWNNRVSNLNWMTRVENEHHNGCHEKTTTKIRKPVEMLDANGNVLKTFKCLWDVKKEIGFDNGYVGNACKRGTKAYGYYWKYADFEKKGDENDSN